MSQRAAPTALRFMRRGVFCIPGPGKDKSGGEDAFFCTSQAVGISDGVGSWAEQGVDPALYARKLMSSCLVASQHNANRLKAYSDFIPLSILMEGYAATRTAKVQGSATAIVAAMIDESKLGILNVGDSGLRIVRNGQLVFGTAEGTFSFNFPYQLGPTSDFQPDQGERSIITLRKGDVLVLGSDGLFDNVYDRDVCRIVAPLCAAASPSTPEDHSSAAASAALSAASVAEDLARFAHKLSVTRSGKSPFGTRAAESGAGIYDGGKPDDITVVVCVADELVGGGLPFEGSLNLAAEAKECPLLLEEFFTSRGKTLVEASFPRSGFFRRSRL